MKMSKLTKLPKAESVRKEWEEFRNICLPLDIPETTREAFRRTFYSGFMIAFYNMAECDKNSLKAFEQELIDFLSEVGREKND